MNFVEVFKQGKEGKNFGLTTGIPQLDQAINGIQKKTSIGVAASPKVGKTTLTDFSFVISPYLQAVRENFLDNIEWIYFSGEIDRISKEFKFAAHFMYIDFGISEVEYKGKKYPMSQDYLMGKLFFRDAQNNLEQVPISKEHEEHLKTIYTNRIIPLFGEYDSKGNRIKKGKIIFIETLENPTGKQKILYLC